LLSDLFVSAWINIVWCGYILTLKELITSNYVYFCIIFNSSVNLALLYFSVVLYCQGYTFFTNKLLIDAQVSDLLFLLNSDKIVVNNILIMLINVCFYMILMVFVLIFLNDFFTLFLKKCRFKLIETLWISIIHDHWYKSNDQVMNMKHQTRLPTRKKTNMSKHTFYGARTYIDIYRLTSF
jgi:hypothetical protein